MFQKLALAVKTKTIEFFAEEEEDDDRSSIAELCLESREEVIPDQRVVVIKPDKPIRSNRSLPPSPPSSSPSLPQSRQLFLQSLASSLFASISAFHAAYLQLQTAEEPFNQGAIEAADRLVVSQLQRLMELKKVYCEQSSNSQCCFVLPSELEAQVLDNQSLLRKYETAFNRLQLDVDCKDVEASNLRQQLKEIAASNCQLKRQIDKFGGVCDMGERESAFLTVRVFELVLKECCRMVHRFTKVLIGLMKHSGWDLESVANSIYLDVDYAKRGHCKFAILSYVCLGMFEGFGSHDFGDSCDGVPPEMTSHPVSQKDICMESRNKLISDFVGQLTSDSLELLDAEPNCKFASFCTKKYEKLIHPKMRASLGGNLAWRESGNPLYEPFVLMSSAVWSLHKLALSFPLPVEIFRVASGVDFSMVYMDPVMRSTTLTGASNAERRKQIVGFTVIPGFNVGRMVIQCKVYLNCDLHPL